MKVAELAKQKKLNHAYLVTGSYAHAPHEVFKMLEERGVSTKGNMDILSLTFTDLSVDDARTISSYASLHAIGEHKYLVIAFSRANQEAQNALLKVVEEAPGNSIFFLCVDAV